jgi:hypothetical protein
VIEKLRNLVFFVYRATTLNAIGLIVLARHLLSRCAAAFPGKMQRQRPQVRKLVAWHMKHASNYQVYIARAC